MKAYPLRGFRQNLKPETIFVPRCNISLGISSLWMKEGQWTTNGFWRPCTSWNRYNEAKATPHNSAARQALSFPPSAACRFLDLPPVNLRNLHLHLTKNPFAGRPPHLCGVAIKKRSSCELRNIPDVPSAYAFSPAAQAGRRPARIFCRPLAIRDRGHDIRSSTRNPFMNLWVKASVNSYPRISVPNERFHYTERAPACQCRNQNFVQNRTKGAAPSKRGAAPQFIFNR